MKQLLEALSATLMNPNGPEQGISVGHDVDEGWHVKFQIQNGPIKENGVNGIQVTDMLGYVLEVYRALNRSFPCRENSLTITKLEEAIHWQDARTKDRIARSVEGENKL